mgnify:CR=1 FL=1|jgi:DNA-binding Lrp family transcriptional regulator
MVNELLKAVQREIPITDRPFKEIGERLGMKEEEVIERLMKLKEEGLIRQISPIYDTRLLGYDSSLVAFKVPEENLEKVADFINAHPGVSHNYEREHEFNLWFTLAVPKEVPLSLEDTVRLIAERTGVREYAILRTIRLFKIGVKLDFNSVEEREEVEVKETKPLELTEEDRLIIKETQEDMPLVERPYLVFAQRLNMKEEELLERLRLYKEAGLIRRVCAILFHRRAGFRANGMAVWKVEKDRVEEVGNYIAGFKGVSHCYERTTNEHWKYNLFSMIHGKSREEVEELVKKVSEETGIREYAVLYSKREFKKVRVRYFSEAFEEWYSSFL